MTAEEWVLASGGAAAAVTLAWVVGGAVCASARSTTAARRDAVLLDEMFDGTQSHITYRTGSGPSGGPTPAVLVAGAMDRGYRFVETRYHGGRTTMEFHRAPGRRTGT